MSMRRIPTASKSLYAASSSCSSGIALAAEVLRCCDMTCHSVSVSESQLPVVEMRPYRWGDHDVELPEAATSALAALGVRAPRTRAVDPGAATVPEPRLPTEARAGL